MGRDKAGVVVDDLAMAEHVRRALAPAVDEVWLSRRLDQDPRVPGLPALTVVRDAGTGPLGGLAAALDRAGPRSIVVAVACDMPFVDTALLRELLAALAGHDAAVPLLDGVPQVGCSAWSESVSRVAAELVASGHGAPRDLVRHIDTVMVDGERWRRQLRSIEEVGDLSAELS